MLAGRRCCRPGPDHGGTVAAGPDLTLAALLPLARTRPEQIMVRCLQDSMQMIPGCMYWGMLSGRCVMRNCVMWICVTGKFGAWTWPYFQ